MKSIVTLAILAIALSASAKPVPKKDTPPAVKPAIPMIPTLPAHTNWGAVTQSGRAVQSSGHPVWDGIGEFRADGKVFILWTLKATGDPCPGVYDWTEGELRGHWGFASDVSVNGKGELEGTLSRDVTHAVDAPKEAVPPGF